jgi:hypothetical protein
MAAGGFPKTISELQTRFPTEEACEAYLAECRWPNGARGSRQEDDEMDHRQSTIGLNPARSTAGDTGNPGQGFIVLRWARHWPYATASLIGLAVWFATVAILAEMAPAASPASGWFGLLVGVLSAPRWLA